MKKSASAVGAFVTLIILLTACSPKFDWREVRGDEAPYLVLMPAKPSVHAREVRLGEIAATMTMRGSEIDGVSFVVGSMNLKDEAAARSAVTTLSTAMLKNAGSQNARQSTVQVPSGTALQVSAEGKGAGGKPLSLNARFMARGPHVYQVVVMGPPERLNRESVETFLDSFKPIS